MSEKRNRPDIGGVNRSLSIRQTKKQKVFSRTSSQRSWFSFMQHPASCGNSLVRRYFRLRPLICRTFSADDSKQADNMYQTIESIQVQNITSLGYCIPIFVHFPNTNVEIFLSYSAQRHLISSSSSFLSLHSPFSIFCFGLPVSGSRRAASPLLSSQIRPYAYQACLPDLLCPSHCTFSPRNRFAGS